MHARTMYVELCAVGVCWEQPCAQLQVEWVAAVRHLLPVLLSALLMSHPCVVALNTLLLVLWLLLLLLCACVLRVAVLNMYVLCLLCFSMLHAQTLECLSWLTDGMCALRPTVLTCAVPRCASVCGMHRLGSDRPGCRSGGMCCTSLCCHVLCACVLHAQTWQRLSWLSERLYYGCTRCCTPLC
jgi:hypothetical protein